MSDIANIKEELLNLIEIKNDKVIIKTLSNIISQIPSKDVYDLFGELSKKDPVFFMMKLYPDIYRKSLEHLRKNYKQNLPELILQMYEYILKTHCFPEDEDKIDFIVGMTFLGNIRFLGAIYLTNKRIINIGVIFKLKTFPVSLWEYLIKRAIRSRQKTMTESILKDMPLAEWGYSFPITNMVSIYEKTVGSLSYYINLKIGEKLKKYRIKIVPKNWPPFKCPKEEFIEHREEFLEQIHQLLLKYQ
ncbi:MAG: hypothetical protein JSV62_07780 [Promethearchaeota archaeon]|nr:MAG: hypothetical protein JSV62_07780 [Candidatus Lokiarchaeota archaeon]